MICGEQMDFNQTSFLKNNRIRSSKLTVKIYKFNWGKYSVYNAGWNTYSLHSKTLSFVHNCSAQRKAARKSIFLSIVFVIFGVWFCFFFKTDFWKHSFRKRRYQHMCPNHSAFTKQTFKKFRTYKEHKLAELKPQLCLLYMWDNSEEDNPVREVFNPPKN